MDPSGDVFVVTGNGSAGARATLRPRERGDRIVTDARRACSTSHPANWAQDNADDGDLGSTAAMLLDHSRLFIVGKEQTAYLLDASKLGGSAGQLSSITSAIPGVATPTGHPMSTWSAPRQWHHRPGPGRPGDDHGTRAGRGPRPTGEAGSPTIAGGVLWTIDIGSSVLYGVDLATGTTRYTLPLTTGTPQHFAAPSIAGGHGGRGGREPRRGVSLNQNPS